MTELVILGGGRCVWDDYEVVRNNSHDIMAINDIGMHIPEPLSHWYSNDAAMLPKWAACRRYSGVGKLHTNNGGGVGVAQSIRVWDFVHGNSAINACLVGISLGYKHITMCGVPLDGSGWYFSPPWERSGYGNDYELDIWKRYKLEFSGRVKFISGRVKDLYDGSVDN